MMGAMADDECTLSDVTVMKANRKGVALSLGISALCVLSMLGIAAKFGLPQGKDGASFINLMVLAALGGGAGAWWFARAARKPADHGELKATRNGVYLRGKRLVAKKEIKSAVLWPGTGEGAFVRITRHGLFSGPIDLRVKSPEEGRALLHALGLDATQAASTLTIAAPSIANLKSRIRGSWLGGLTMFAGVVGAAAAAHSGVPGAAAAAIGLAGFLFHASMMLRLFRSGSVVVGADGVYISWLWHKQFIPIQDIVRAEVIEGDAWATMLPVYVRLHTSHGEPIDLVGGVGRTSAFGNYNRFARMRADVVAERINEAALGKGQGASSAIDWSEGILTRGERAAGEWVAALRGLKEKAQTFRDAASATDVFERLWQILEDAQASATRRAAAAVALSPHIDDQGRERLRVAAQATATPKLRIALEAAADDDDDRLVRALDDVAALEEIPAKRVRAAESA